MRRSRRVRMVKGPAKLRVKGKCKVLGADVSDSTVTVRPGKALPFEPLPNCRLQIRAGLKGRAWWATPQAAGTHIWRKIASEVFGAVERHSRLTVMVTGDTDVGKSTLCTYLANEALSRGTRPCVVDGDIGQGDIAPPSAIGAAALEVQVTDLRDATAGIFEFIGTISAAGAEEFIAQRLRSICQKSSGLGRLQLLNTDGYARDGGVGYKRLIADSVEPDFIVCMGQNKPLEEALASPNWRLLRAASSVQAWKSRPEREWRRYDQFIRFAGKSQVRKDLTGLTFRYLGNECAPPDVYDLFVGLGRRDLIVGFGIIQDIASGIVSLQTDVLDFDCVHLSNIRIAGRTAKQVTVQMPGLGS